jgi:hypothetical protein
VRRRGRQVLAGIRPGRRGGMREWRVMAHRSREPRGGGRSVALEHRAEKWMRFSAPNDAPANRRSIGPKSGPTFGSDALAFDHAAQAARLKSPRPRAEPPDSKGTMRRIGRYVNRNVLFMKRPRWRMPVNKPARCRNRPFRGGPASSARSGRAQGRRGPWRRSAGRARWCPRAPGGGA